MSMTDEVWVGPNPPTDPDAELWFDTDAVGTIPPPAGGGTGAPPYDDTQVRTDIAQNTADIAAVAQASLQGDAGLDTRVTSLEGAPAPTYTADDIAETATRVWVTPAEKAAIGTGGGTTNPPYDDTQIKADLAAETTERTSADTALDGRVTANTQAIAAIPAPTAPFDPTSLQAADSALDTRVTALEAAPAPVPHWFGAQTDYDVIPVKDPAVLYVITGP